MKIACYTDIHNQQCMLNIPCVLRKSAVDAAKLTIDEWGKADISIVGGDNISDYPYWNRSCALPYANWLDIKAKLVDNFARTANGGRVLYINGNNDLMLGDLPTAENPPYNTCEFYESGPMKETLGEFSDSECYSVYAKSKGKQAGLYQLAFHYVVDGIDFFGINIDPNTSFNSHDGTYNSDALKWLKNKICEVDPDNNKLIFVVGHLSATVRYNGELTEDMDEEHRSELYNAFLGHRNLFYLYGHIHGQNYMHSDSADGVIHFDNHGNVAKNYTAENLGFHNVHMGGLRPFTTEKPFEYFENDGLTGAISDEAPQFYEATGTPKIAQYLLIETDSKKVTFSYRNTGVNAGFTPDDKPLPYTVELI